MKNLPKTPGDQALEILQHTRDGEALDPADLYLLQEAVNGNLTEAGMKAFQDLYQAVVVSKNYTKPFLAGVEHMTRDHQGYVLYKNQIVEHYSFHLIPPSDLPAMVKALQQDCQELERLGLPVVGSYLHDKKLWQGLQPHDPFLFFIQHGQYFYEREDTLLHYDGHEPDKDSRDIVYFYRLIKLKSRQSRQGKVKGIGRFHQWLESKGFSGPQNCSSREEWEKWIARKGLKLWLLNPEAFPAFAIKSMEAGHTIEVPESMYLEYMQVTPPKGQNEPRETNRWFVHGRPYDQDNDLFYYYGFFQKGTSYFARSVVLPVH